ncbi:hypothetical protein BDD12DRAFT_903524 [Trichophaea hybrida]|nr:hypothetical protein BDD12DRAFT_903524 [Trichophaea hybrida]
MWIPRLPQLAIIALFVGGSLAAPKPVAAPKSASAGEDPCTVLASLLKHSRVTSATAALNCLRSVPFSKPQALELIANLRLFSRFAASQAYYRSPINPALEIPEFDINDTISTIESRAKTGYYQNGFEFWRAVSLAYANFRDGHMRSDPYCGGKIFYWYHNYPIVAIGQEIYTIIFPGTVGTNSTHTPRLGRKVTHINRQPSVQFLLELSRTLPDLSESVDPDTRWNALMENYPVRRGQFALRSLWGGEEEEQLLLTFEGAEEEVVEWQAWLGDATLLGFNDTTSFANTVCYVNPAVYELWSPKIAGPVWKKDPSGKTFNSMLSSVLSPAASSSATSEVPQSTNATTTNIPSISSTPSATTPTISLVGYPTPLARGPDDTLVFFPDPDKSPSIAILRIPSYQVWGATLLEWDIFLNNTLTQLGESGIKRLLIDVSGNGGGSVKLAKRTVHMIFPESFQGVGHEPEYYIRWRYHSALVKIFQAPATPYTIDFNGRGSFTTLQGRNFSSANDILGPHYNPRVKDYFTAEGIPTRDLLTPQDEGVFPRKNYWRTQDVVIISNGLCASACHMFTELMEQMGVRTYAIGGRPGYRMMQAVGGTKSGILNTYESVVVETFRLFGDTSNYTDFPKFLATSFWIETSLENIFRPGAEETPLFFTFTPACKKVPITKEMVTDVTEVWRAVKKLAWAENGDATGCDHGDNT